MNLCFSESWPFKKKNQSLFSLSFSSGASDADLEANFLKESPGCIEDRYCFSSMGEPSVNISKSATTLDKSVEKISFPNTNFLWLIYIHFDRTKQQPGSPLPPSVSVEPGKSLVHAGVYQGKTTL